MKYLIKTLPPLGFFIRQSIIVWCGLYCSVIFSQDAVSLSGEAYLKRFMTYQQWSDNLPQIPDDQFLTFISKDAPLSNKLRNKWLYKLAQSKDWINYNKYYKSSADMNLQCFAHFAQYNEGKTTQALQAAQKIWLSPQSQPPGCTQLFNLLQKSEFFTKALISNRIILSLDTRNISLASYLLNQYKTSAISDAKLLIAIHQNPTKIAQIEPGSLHDYFYLYGLKRLIQINMDKAISYWKTQKAQKLLSHEEKQAFLAHLALYKAMRNQDDTEYWFSKIEPAYYNDVLLDWQIRFALRHLQWKRVAMLIHYYHDKDNPCWQYWLARSYEAQGKHEESTAIYTRLAKTRHYYGFLASLRIKQKPDFQNDKAVPNLSLLKPYQPITNLIRSLYNAKQTLKASQLLNDFISELPKADKLALIYWIDHQLQWHAKSVYLSNNDELNNYLSLRFPLAYNQTIHQKSQNYDIPEEFIYAIIRQESGFREDVVSAAGARGLMQLLPTTAKLVAKSAKIPYSHQDQLFSSQHNIPIGTAYLATLAKRFSHHPILMAAAYNAGPRQVVNWLKNNPTQQMDIWIETLPYPETRNYLKNVIAFYTVYQYRMQKTPNLHQLMKAL